MNENILNEESNTLTENLVRIRDAANGMRATVEMTSENSIEDVADAVSDLKAENEQLKYDLEHCEDRVFNEYYNMNLNECENWRDLEKKGVPFHANGATNLANFFASYPGKYIKVVGEWGKPTDINRMFDQCQATDVDIPLIDTSLTENFEYMFSGCKVKPDTVQRLINNFNISHATNVNGLFCGYRQASSEHPLNVNRLDVSNLHYLNEMFRDAANITGYENWDVSNVYEFNGLFCSFRPEWDEEQHRPVGAATIDLTNWELGTQHDWISFYQMFCDCHAKRIIMPIDNSLYADNTNWTYFCSGRDLEYADFRGLTFGDNMYQAFYDLSPMFVIIVKDTIEKQKLMSQYPNLLFVYTPEEYENRDETLVHFNFINWDGESCIDDPSTAYTLFIWDPNANDWRNVNWFQYTSDTANKTIPAHYKYKIEGYIEYRNFEAVEFEADEEEKTITVQGGIPNYNYNITTYDQQGQLLTTSMELYKKVRWEDEWEYCGVTEEGHGSVRFKENDYGYILVKDLNHFYQPYNINTGYMHEDKSGSAYMYLTQVNITSLIYYDNGEQVPREHLTYWDSFWIGDRQCSIYNNPGEYNSDLTYKDVVENDLTCTCVMRIDLQDVYTQTFTKDDIVVPVDNDYTVYWHMDTVTIPTPSYNNVTIYIRDQETEELINANMIKNAYLYKNNSTGGRYHYQYENPKTFAVPNNTHYIAECEGNEIYSYNTGSVTMHEEDADINIYLYKLVHFNIDYKKANGEFVDHGDYKEYKIVAFNQNDEYMWMDGVGTWDYGQTYHFNKSKGDFENVAYVRIGVWDTRLNESNGGFVANPNIITYDPNILTYAVTVQQCDDPIVWTEDPETGAYTTTNRQVVEDLRMEMCACGPGWGSMRLDENNRFIHYYNMPVNVLDTDYRITKCWQMGTGDEGTTVPIVSIQTINGTETVKVEND